MALATQCPHCQTRFRVASDQLKLRGGIVRCGACQRIFDGSAHLIDLEAPVAEGAMPAAAPPAPPSPSPPPEPVTEPAAASADEPAREPASALPAPSPAQENTDAVDVPAQPVYTLDVERTFEPRGILPRAEADVEPVAAQPHAPEPPHGDVLAQAVEAIAEAEAGAPAPDVDEPAPQPRDPEPPHGDVLAPAVQVVVEKDAADSIPPAGIEPARPQPQDPEPPHGDALAHALDTAAHAPQQRIEPRLEPISFARPARIEPSFDLPVDEELVAQPMRGHEQGHEPGPDAEAAGAAPPIPPLADDAPPLPLRASAGAEVRDTASQAPFAAASATPAPRSARAKAAEARARRTRLIPTRIEAPKLRVPETDEPEFVKRSRKQEQTGRMRRILMGVGAALLLLVLASQVVLNFRNVLAARYPGARPALESACALLGCRVELPTQIDNLAIENGELITLGPDTYSLNTLLRNQGSLVQAWPSIELELTDANDKPVLRRVFAPADYLPQNTATGAAAGGTAAGFGGRSEQAIKLHFALDDLKPSGYHIFIFYP